MSVDEVENFICVLVLNDVRLEILHNAQKIIKVILIASRIQMLYITIKTKIYVSQENPIINNSFGNHNNT